MATASAPVQRTYEIGDLNSHPIKASTKIYQGSAVGQAAASAVVRPLVATDKFLGFATDTFDNSAGADAAKTVTVKHEGLIRLTVAGLATTTPIGTSVYASDDNTFTLTSAGNSLIGKVHRVENGGTIAVVAFSAPTV